MDRRPRDLVIDARPRGPSGPLAGEQVQGRTVLDHLLDVAQSVSSSLDRVTVHARPEEHSTFAASLSARPIGRFLLASGPPTEGAAVLRADRLYDPGRLRRALRKGKDPESAVIWRLDRPAAIASATDELIRRQTYQPLGRFWAIGPARFLARLLAPTRVRPNAVTLASAALMLTASALVASGLLSWTARLVTAGALALALVLDTADGHLARLQGTASAFGRWLDAWLDELCDLSLHAAIAWAAFGRTGAVGWLLVGMLYASGKYVFLIGTMDVGSRIEGSGAAARKPRSRFQDAFRLAGHADVRWHLWIVLAAAGRLDAALAAYALYYPARTLLGAAWKAVRRA